MLASIMISLAVCIMQKFTQKCNSQFWNALGLTLSILALVLWTIFAVSMAVMALAGKI
jgi:hypothetical protein